MTERKTTDELIDHCRRLHDTQWINVVNHDNCYRAFTKEDAIAQAVKLTEKYMCNNFNEYLIAQPAAVDAASEDARDAARYRFLRRKHGHIAFLGDTLDTRIDAAMAAAPQAGGAK